MKSLDNLAKGASYAFIGMVCSKILTYFYRIIIARIGPEEYGLLSLGLAIFGILGIFSMFGLNVGITRYVAYYKAKQDERRVKGTITSALKIGFILSTTIAILLFIFSEKISLLLFHNPDLAIILKILAPVLPLYTMRDIFFAVIRSYGQRTDYETYFRNIGENVIKLSLTIILLYAGYKVIGAAVAYSVAIALTFVASIILSEKIFPILKTKIVSIKENKALLYYSIPVLLATLLSEIIVWTDILMIGYFKNMKSVGIYNTALPTATLLSIMPGSIIALLIPIITTLYIQKRRQELIETYKTATKWIFIINIFILGTLFIHAPSFLEIFFGTEYIAATMALQILIFGNFYLSISLPSIELLKSIKKTHLILLNTMIASIANIVLNTILIPIYGFIGGAIATSISYFIYGTFTMVQSRKKIRAWPFKWNYILIIPPALITYIISNLIATSYTINTFVLLAATSIFTFLIYITGLYLFKAFDKQDLIIIDIIKNKLKRIN